MFPLCVLLVNWMMACSGTKTRLVSGGMHLWKHSIVRIAREQFNGLKKQYAGADTTAIINVAKFAPTYKAEVTAPFNQIRAAPQLDISQLGSVRVSQAPPAVSSASYSCVNSDDEMFV